jgi:hypothetical protein
LNVSSLDPIRRGGLAAILAGVAWTLSGVFAFVFPGESAGPLGSASAYLVESAHAVAEGGMLVWLIGLYALQRPRHGRLGKAGLLAAFVGTALLFLLTVFTPLQMFLAFELGVIDPRAGGVLVTVLFTAGLLLGWLVGYTLLGIATFRAKALPRWCGLLLVAQCPLLFFLMASYSTGAAVLGAVWLALGYALLTEGDEAAKTPRVA